MERKIKLLLTAVAMLFGVSQVYANGDFIVDGMAYEVNEDGVSVTLVWKDLNEPYSGDVVVPASVTFEDKTYTVNQIGYLAFSHVTRLVNGSRRTQAFRQSHCQTPSRRLAMLDS